MGVPVFTCDLTPDGDPLHLPKNWERITPSHERVDRWRKGQALCATTGVVFDVIDIDPRNGGNLSFKRMARELGEDGPEVYWEVKTPSGGSHLYIEKMDMGTRPGFIPGIDLKGGLPNGTSRGFVFLPPTRRPSKASGAGPDFLPYRPVRDLYEVNGHRTTDPLQDYVNKALSERTPLDGPTSARSSRSALREACLSAPAGGQREALLRYVHELERAGYEADDIVDLTMSLVRNMPVYDERRPWREKHVRGLLHKPGTVIADGTDEELEGIAPISRKIVQPVSDIERKIVEWLWPGYLAFYELTMMDGEKGQGKTFVTDDVAARASRGRPMPGQDTAAYGPLNVIIFTDEGRAESVLKPRLIACGADQKRIFIPKLAVPKKGSKTDWPLALPDGAGMIARIIRESNAQLAIFDPITDFLDETINTHNDASVRRALRPLSEVLDKTGCAGWALRHMNKDRNMAAKFRGTGSSAFQNRARVHIVAGEIDGSIEGQSVPDDRVFGLAVADTNMTARKEGVLAYSIRDSKVVMDEQGNMVGKVHWHGYVTVHAEELTGAERRRGPAPSEDREMAKHILTEMFNEKETWPAEEVKDVLKESGISISRPTLDKVRADLGIRSVPQRKKGQFGVASWVWTTRKEKVGE